jgi:hypothetical protein
VASWVFDTGGVDERFPKPRLVACFQQSLPTGLADQNLTAQYLPEHLTKRPSSSLMGVPEKREKKEYWAVKYENE